MHTNEVITLVVLVLISLIFFVLGYFQFKEKGVLLNNAYIYASKEERKQMNKRPHYRQSAVVFVMIGIMFLFNAIEMFFKSGWLYYFSIGLIILLIIYAIVSSIMINRK
ncbi:MAG: DUF3784 domain-containing protein [Clostridiales bacterium]|jgi:membrane-anchored glycerophosphoryl diester phosphodiesterase (GDPDase)|nr:DUF3784 domain-containing protein [Clostridiales bacterium]